MVTKTEVSKSSLGSKKGWAFSVYFNSLPYPNLIGALYKTKRTCQQQLDRYLKTGKFDFYGDAE